MRDIRFTGYMRNVISNSLHVPYWVVDHEGTLEMPNGVFCEEFFASFGEPNFCCGFVCFKQDDGIRVSWVRSWMHPVMTVSNVCNEQCQIFQKINADEGVLNGSCLKNSRLDVG